MNSKDNNLLGVLIKNQKIDDILEKIRIYLHNPYTFFHVVSLNPENMMIAREDLEYQKILSEADIQLIDGIGIALGCSILKIPIGGRVTGVDFMNILLKKVSFEGLRVLFIGGRSILAKTVADCYCKKYPQISFQGVEGIADIQNPKVEELARLHALIDNYKPNLVFAAFGSPWQEKLFACHKDIFKGIVCVGVGGAFDFEAGNIPRAPVWIRQIGFEWLYRLYKQPFRWRRQIRIAKYIALVLVQKIFNKPHG